MIKIRDVWVNHVEADISSVVDCLKVNLSGYPYVLVSTIDSGRNLAEFTSLQKIARLLPFEFIGENLLLETADFYELVNTYHIFNGFDEVWFFSQRPSAKLPPSLGIIPPLDIVNEFPDELPEWMRNNNCVLGLGDGIGLNYVTTDYRLAELIEEMSR